MKKLSLLLLVVWGVLAGCGGPKEEKGPPGDPPPVVPSNPRRQSEGR